MLIWLDGDTNTKAQPQKNFGRELMELFSRGVGFYTENDVYATARVRGGLYGTAASLNPDPQNPTLENNGADTTYETDFRSVYAKVVDNWLGGNSVNVLGGNFKKSGIDFV